MPRGKGRLSMNMLRHARHQADDRLLLLIPIASSFSLRVSVPPW